MFHIKYTFIGQEVSEKIFEYYGNSIERGKMFCSTQFFCTLIKKSFVNRNRVCYIVVVGNGHQGEEAVVYVAYFIYVMGVERRDKSSALFHIIHVYCPRVGAHQPLGISFISELPIFSPFAHSLQVFPLQMTFLQFSPVKCMDDLC